MGIEQVLMISIAAVAHGAAHAAANPALREQARREAQEKWEREVLPTLPDQERIEYLMGQWSKESECSVGS